MSVSTKLSLASIEPHESARSFHRHALSCGSIDASDNFVDTDISGEDADVQAICTAAWTQAVKDAYKAHLIANKPEAPAE